jgi:hypothetical protein
MQHDVLHSDGTIEIGMARSTVRLAASRDRLLPRLMVSSERKTELAPYRNQGISQLPDQPIAMRGGRGNPQSFGAFCAPRKAVSEFR